MGLKWIENMEKRLISMMDDGILLAKYGVNNVHLFGDINVIQHDLSRERIVKTGGYEMQINRHGNILIIFFIIFQYVVYIL
jgi:hypothetical protein